MEKIFLVTVFCFSTIFVTFQTSAQEVKLHVDFTGSSFDAKTNQVTGQARVVGKKVLADRVSVNLQTLSSGIQMRDQHLKKALDVTRFPQAVMTNVKGEDGKFTADLNIHGVSKKAVEGEYSIEGKLINAQLKVNMTDYNIPSQTYMGGTISVDDEVEIHASLPSVTAAK